MNKKEKRKIKEKDRGIVDIAVIANHFFKDLLKWINEMNDPRQRGYIKYEQSDFIILGILKNICGVETMRQMDEKFNKENCIKTLKMISKHSPEGLLRSGECFLTFYLKYSAPDSSSGWCLSPGDVDAHIGAAALRVAHLAEHPAVGGEDALDGPPWSRWG